MSRQTGIRVERAQVSFVRRPFLRPLRLSSGTITEITEARAEVAVVCGSNGAIGRGSVYLSDLWAWPDPSRTPDERDAEMRTFTDYLASVLPGIVGSDFPHPLEAGLRLHQYALTCTSDLPPLARLVCLSPLDAALHDAVGISERVSSFSLYKEDAPIPSADAHFADQGGAIAAIRKMLRIPPTPVLDATYVVGKGDDLHSLVEWIQERKYRSFKLKVGGTNPQEDADRVADVYQWAHGAGIAHPRLTVDANCATPNADTVAAFLDTLESTAPDAAAALESIEQPTGRDIGVHDFDWHPTARRRPILLDEGLIDWNSLTVAQTQGWYGMAVKTCRGHSFSLAAAAWAHAHGWTLTVMDLTNPGYAAIHSALLAAHLPGVTAIEMNAPQYTPAANADWLPRLAPLLEPRDGIHRLPETVPVGLGSQL